MRWFRTIYDLLAQTVGEFNRDNGSMLSAGITYYALFSLAPLLVVSVGVASLLLGSLSLDETLTKELEKLMGTELAQMITQMPARTGGSRLSGWAATIAAAGVALYGAARLFIQVQRALNAMWGVRARRGAGWRSYVRGRLPVVIIVLLLGVALAVASIASVVAALLNSLVDRFLPDDFAGLSAVASPLVLLAVGWLVFVVIFALLPDAKIPLRRVWLGAALTSLGWVLATVLFDLYLSLGGGSAYATAGAVVVLLVFVHYLAYIFLLMAKLTHVMAVRAGSLIVPRPWAVAVPLPAEEAVDGVGPDPA